MPSARVAALVLLCFARAGAGADLLPLADVRPGMQGVGRTVFEGARVDEFGVRILGVLENAVGPRQSIILARLEGGPLAETGVIAGMSGSPVFVDGRLVGAVAYAFPFGKEAIAGLTPIGDMIAAGGDTSPRPAAARLHAPGLDGTPLDRSAVAATLRRSLPALATGTFRGEALPAGVAGASLSPLALPLVLSGFDPETFDWARGVFSAMGFAPVMGGGAAGRVGPLPDLEPGAAVGISLVEGDLDLSVTGTVTHIDDGRVYAFGHPFYSLGPTRFPMKKAWVYAVFPSLQVSWKIAAALDTVGTMDQDRTTAVSGRLGEAPGMIPVEVRLRSARAGERTFRFRVVDDELFTPVLGYVSLLSVLQGHARALGAATLRLDARLLLAGGREVRVRDVVAADQAAQQAAAVVARPLALLVGNDFEKVAIERLEVAVDALETLEQATLVRTWVDGPSPLRPGTVASVKVQLRTRRGETLTETLPVAIPQSAPSGSYTLLVADAATMDAVEQREKRQGAAARDLAQLLRLLNGLRSGSGIYARLTRPAGGAVVGGEYLPALPGSVLSVLGSSDQGTSVVPLPASPVWSGELTTDHAVSGWRQLTLAVERR
ncbi:MAG TPA: SpoIVB peptidase S55 domain-containing protein [Vicinamibacteria bacterium]|nr:SpoIVB peptidase S55 domain-containing protein [Vicinamibacteria bacterium]